LHAGLVVAALVGLVVPLTAVAAAPDTYADYSMMSQRRSGLHASGGEVAGSWSWVPLAGGEARVTWIDSGNEAGATSERFVRSGGWVLLDGWWGNGTYYTQRVTTELVGDADCRHMVAIPSAGQRQHYVRWSVPSQPYCIRAWGTVTERSTGTTMRFAHTQIWYPPSPCHNPYYGWRTCIRQWESWWDNHGDPAAPISRKVERTGTLARGLGPAFTVEQHFPVPWRADLAWDRRW